MCYMNFFKKIIEFFKSLLKFNDPAYQEIRKLNKILIQKDLHYYNIHNHLITTDFAKDLFLFVSALRPLIDLSDHSIGHPDIRTSKKFTDYIIDMHLPNDVLELKSEFLPENIKSKLENAVMLDQEVEKLNQDFQKLIQKLDQLDSNKINEEIFQLQCFVEICRFDWERVLSFFDPGVTLSQKDYAYNPQNCEAEHLENELIDIYYLLNNFLFSSQLINNLGLLLAKIHPERTGNLETLQKICNILNKFLNYKLSGVVLLTLVRLAKKNSEYTPNLVHERQNTFLNYKIRITENFETVRNKLQREMREMTVNKDIQKLFANTQIIPVEEYNEETNLRISQDTPFHFTHIRPLSILKTFVQNKYETEIRDIIKKILIEGYFDNKSFQNNLANLVYQCDKTMNRIRAFERNLKGTGRSTIVSIKRYVDEMKHGKDISQFLQKIIDEINSDANEICEDESGLFLMLYLAITDLLNDQRKPNPDILSNIRTIGGLHNRELIASLNQSKDTLELFIKVMRSFVTVRGTIVQEE